MAEYCAEHGCDRRTGDVYRCPEHARENAARMAKYRVTQRQKREMAKRAHRN